MTRAGTPRFCQPTELQVLKVDVYAVRNNWFGSAARMWMISGGSARRLQSNPFGTRLGL